MHNRIFNDVSIEQDLGIPLSYDAAWKIFNRWPREVRGQRRRLGEKKCDTAPPHRSCCYCSQQSCTSRCPFFGLCKKEAVSAEEKLPGIMSHVQAEQPRIKGMLNNINEWYNAKCTAEANGTLDLTPLGPLKIKYKLPAYDVSKIACKRFQAYNLNSGNNPPKTKTFINKPKRKCATLPKKKMTTQKAILERSSSELYDTIEKQLRNLSVSQSRLQHMSASLCRLAYAKKKTSKTKLKPKVIKPKNDFYNALKFLNISTNGILQNSSSNSPNLDSKSSKQSKSTKSSKTSKTSKSNKSGKSGKARKTSGVSKSEKSKKNKMSTNESTCNKTKINSRFIKPKKQQTDSKRYSTRAINPGTIQKIPIQRIGGGGCNECNPKYSRQTKKSSGSYSTVILGRATDGTTKAQSTVKTTNDRTAVKKLSNKRTIIGSNGSAGALICGDHFCEISIDRKGLGKREKNVRTQGISRPTVAVLSKITVSKSSLALRRKKSNSVPAIKDRFKCRS